MKYLSLLLVAVCVACGPGKKEELQTLKDEVIGIHDEVMPKMGQLRSLRKQLSSGLNSFNESDSSKVDMANEIIGEIDGSIESMMSWMSTFESDFKGSEEEALNYFRDQRTNIQTMNNDIQELLGKGEDLLIQISNQEKTDE